MQTMYIAIDLYAFPVIFWSGFIVLSLFDDVRVYVMLIFVCLFVCLCYDKVFRLHTVIEVYQT